ncbi:hypothetical protein NECID01_1066 [Nematocida sp. AWRm77]|nr:hypothetical protein NECID01_1066 [Nematocida sp. AWRm77]
MQRSEYVVNIVAHVNHGKTTFMDNMLEHAGVLSRAMAGEARLLDTRKDEIERGITMKISPFTIWANRTKITFLDTPGHLEFSSLTLSTFVVCDASVIVVDVLGGVTERLKGLVKKAEESKTGIVLFINKVDMLFSKHMEPGSIGHQIEKIVQDVQAVSQNSVGWAQKNLIIGSAKDNWAISGMSDPKCLLKNRSSERVCLSLKQAVSLLCQMYAADSTQKEALYARAGLEGRKKRDAKSFPKDLLSHIFNFFHTVSTAIVESTSPKPLYAPQGVSIPEEVIGVVCTNTLVDGVITAIARTVHNKSVCVGSVLQIQEPEGGVSEGTVESTLLFVQDNQRFDKQAGLIGVQGVSCKKRGLIVTKKTEETESFLKTLPWTEFSPVFTDVLLPSPDLFQEVVQRIELLSQCEPGIHCSVTPAQEIVIQSDGELQLDKIKTDLEEFQFTTKERSERYMETVERGEGVVCAKNMQCAVSFTGIEIGTQVSSKAKKMFGRLCYVEHTEDTPGELLRAVSSLLQQGPYLREPCDKILVKITPVQESCSSDMDSELPEKTSSLQEIYMQSAPRLITTYATLTINIPSECMKKSSIAASKMHAKVLNTEYAEDTASVQIRIPVKELRAFIKELRTLSRGECDVFLDKEVEYAVPESRVYEDAMAETVREEKGLFRKERIEDR